MEVGTFIFTKYDKTWVLGIEENKTHSPSCNHGTIVLVQIS
jgi:hypothetical protein